MGTAEPEQWARWAPTYERGLSGKLLRPLYDAIFQMTAPQPGERLLDVGAGSGPVVLRALARSIHAVGIDASAAMTTVAHRRAPGSFVQAVAEALPFHDGAFDIVTTSLSLHHWDAPRDGFAEIARVLRPGGRTLVADVEGRGVLQNLANRIRRHGGRYVTRDQIGEPLQAAGLTPRRQVVLKRRWVLTLAQRG